MFQNECTLLVMSCDKYETAWFPYFELLRKYWPEHPLRIVLCTDSKTYSHQGLNIECVTNDTHGEWSDRLLSGLKHVHTDYIVFSLEDFFLQGRVDHNCVERCFQYMKNHPEIAQCRFKNCDNREQIEALGAEVLPNFYEAGPEVIFRLDTQIALWNKNALCSFIISGENPWRFETDGTQRIKTTEKIFLWYKSKEDADSTQSFVFPYQMSLMSGYGISMGHWLWNNQKLFRSNDVSVDLSQLGVLTRRQVRYRLLVNKAVWQKDSSLFCRCFAFGYRVTHKVKRLFIKS